MGLEGKSTGRKTRQRLEEKATLTERTLMVALRADSEPFDFQYRVRTPESMAGFYIVDFHLPRRNLLVELDGAHHFTQQGRWNDRLRAEAIERAKPKHLLVRFPNSDVVKDAAALVRYLKSF